MTKKTNFVLFITDQQRADWMGCAGHPVVRTPNIDSIAATGTRFQDFHVAMPVCSPNRASLMTGRMPSVHGLRYNGALLAQRSNTFADVLSAGGYATASFGKSHLQPILDIPARAAVDTTERLIPEAMKPEEGTYTLEEPSSFEGNTVKEFEVPYYGFQHVDIVTSHGDRCGGQYGQWFRQTVPNWQELHDPANELAHNYTCPQAYRTPVPEEIYPTTWVADKAIDYIEGRADEDEPFFAFISFPDPHHPFNPPGKYWDMYSPDEFDVPLPYDAHKNPTPPMKHVSEMWEAGMPPPTPQTAFRADDQHVREAMALTAGMITMIDDQIGRVLQVLKDTGQYDNTVIIFTSDHGDYLGDFNLMLKGPMQNQSITRVPMIWSDPDTRTGVQTDTLASTIDISASILDRAGLAPYFGIQGKSFLKSLDGTKSHRDEVLIEHNDGWSRLGYKAPARARTIRTQDWRLTVNAGEDWGEFYDLQVDPQETNNLWGEPTAATAKAALSMRLVESLTHQMDESPRASQLA